MGIVRSIGWELFAGAAAGRRDGERELERERERGGVEMAAESFSPLKRLRADRGSVRGAGGPLGFLLYSSPSFLSPSPFLPFFFERVSGTLSCKGLERRRKEGERREWGREGAREQRARERKRKWKGEILPQIINGD